MELGSHDDSAGEFCCVGSTFSMKLLEFVSKTIKLLLTELVGQCRIILPLAFSALTSFRSVNTKKAAGNIILHWLPTQLIRVYYSLIHFQSECILKINSVSYVQNMIENMILTTYLDRCFLLVMNPDSSLFSKYYYNIPSDWMYWKYQFELCSKYDREYDFAIILSISRTLSQAKVEISQAFNWCPRQVEIPYNPTILSHDKFLLSHNMSFMSLQILPLL